MDHRATAPDCEPLYTYETLAEHLQISRAWVYVMASEGRLPKPIRFGKLCRWRRAEIAAWLEAGAPPQAEWERMKREAADAPRSINTVASTA